MREVNIEKRLALLYSDYNPLELRYPEFPIGFDDLLCFTFILKIGVTIKTVKFIFKGWNGNP